MCKMQAFGILKYLCQPFVKSCNTDFEAPKNGSVERPSYDLDLGTPDTIVVLFRVWVEVLTLFGLHVAVCEAIELGGDGVGRYDIRNEKRMLHIYVSVSSHHNANSVFRLIRSPEASISSCIYLPIGWSYTSSSYADPDYNGG